MCSSQDAKNFSQDRTLTAGHNNTFCAAAKADFLADKKLVDGTYNSFVVFWIQC
ncbi:hypothetical protein L915_03080 [Phytophthora nicotianae]|uniref:Uncharacterized protein n=1 Tax=Phytophthora nicotianae TaxID=4792 RepID=W2HF69_PHYNI|nr:hypothetical protein L915_03080 [Phytophthora nicotianae]